MAKDFLTANNLNRIEGFIDRVEGDRLARYAATVPDGSCIVEIGSASGSGALYLASGMRQAGRRPCVVCFDPYETSEENAENYRLPLALSLFEARAAYVGFSFGIVGDESEAAYSTPEISVAKMRSLDGAKAWARWADTPPIGMLHIDGLHEYEHASADFRAWAPLVAPGGVIVMHDLYNAKHGWDVLGAVTTTVLESGMVKEIERPRWDRYKGRRRGQWIGRKIG